MMRSLWTLPLILAGCASDEKYIVVTVESRAAVHDVAKLRVTLSNAGSSRSEDIPVGGAMFPATFSISPEERTGDLEISIDAFDEDEGLVGRGAAQSTIETPTAKVLLEPTDFVVNTEYADNQQISNYFAGSGFQVAAAPTGTWITSYNAACPTPCNVFGRRFDATGRAVSSAAAAGTMGFPLSTKLTTRFYGTSGVAANAAATMAFWTNQDPVTTTSYSVECRALDPTGAAASAQVQIAPDEFPDSVSATPLAGGNFALIWDARVTNYVIRAAVVRPDCTPVGGVATVSASVAGEFPGRSHLAANATNILYAWVLSGNVRVRAARLDGVFDGVDTQIIAKTATEQVEFVRIAPLASGFALIVRWALITGSTGPGRLELYRVSSTGTVMGAPTLISTRSGSDFESSESFGVAARDNGTSLVVWHACLDRGDGQGCGVFGRLISATGDPIGAELVIPTTTTGDQTRPSAAALPSGAFAVAWTDASMTAPDTSGSAVRARIIYPELIQASSQGLTGGGPLPLDRAGAE